MKKIISIVLAAALLGCMLVGCGSSNETTTAAETTAAETTAEETTTAGDPVELIVFAAASMTETLTQIQEAYKEVAPNVTLTFNFDSSGTLKTQIQEGADCDIFISAAPSR